MQLRSSALIFGISAIVFTFVLQAQDRPPRRVYLNGIDISSTKHQFLERVNIRIDGQGNIFIEAPHYNVIEESSYVPLSSLANEKAARARHKEAGPFPGGAQLETPIQPLRELSKQAKPIPEQLRIEPEGDR